MLQIRKNIIYIGIIVLLIFINFSNILDNFFLTADGSWLAHAQLIKKDFKNIVLPFEGYFKPSINFIFFIKYSIFHLTPSYYHLFSILIHVFNSILIYLLALFLTSYIFSNAKHEIALLSGIFFALTFSHHQPILHVAGLHELMGCLFFLLTTYSFLLSITKNKTYYLILSLIFYSVGLLSRELVIIFLAMLPLLFFYITDRLDIKKIIKLLIPYSIISIIYLLLYQTYAPFHLNPHKHEVQLGFHFIKNMINCLPEFLLSCFGFSSFNLIYKLFAIEKIIIYISSLSIISCIILNKNLLKILKETYSAKLLKYIILLVVFILISFLPASFFTYLSNILAGFSARYRYLYLPSCGAALLFGIIIYILFILLKNNIKNFAYIIIIVYLTGFILTNMDMNSQVEKIFENDSEDTKVIISAINSATADKIRGKVFMVNFPYETIGLHRIHMEDFIKVFLNKEYEIYWVDKSEIMNKIANKEKELTAENIFFIEYQNGRLKDETGYYKQKIKKVVGN